MFSTQQYFGFDPRTIPGCALWLDSADSNTLFSDSAGTTPATVGGTVGYWADKSPAGRHFTQTTTANRPSRDTSTSVTFSTADQLLINASTTWTSTGWDIFFVTNVLSTTSWRTMLRGNTTNPDVHVVILANTNDFGYYNGTDLAFRRFGTLSLAAGSRRLGFVSISAARAYAGALDGTIATSAATGTGKTDSQLFYYLGNSAPGAAQPWGTIHEVIILPTTTTAQRQQVEGYLAWKWGIQANLPTGHPFKSNPTTMRVFRPIDMSNCFLWLDGADASTVGVSGSSVTSWRDKSVNGHNLTTISATPPTYSPITGAITFTAANLNSIRGSLTTSLTNPISTFIVCSLTNPNVSSGRNLLMFGTSGASTTYLAGQLTYVDTAATPAFYTYANDAQNPTGRGINIQTYTQTSYNTVGIFENFSTYSGTSLTINTFLNGNTSANSSRSTTWTASSPYVTTASYVAIGNDTGAAATAAGCFNGDIYEIIVFNRTLSTAERQQIEGYLASKWRISGLLPTTQPYYLQRALPSTPLFTPTALSGAALWLDAADSSTFTFSSGSNISQWRDKSVTSTTANVSNGPTANPITFTNGGVYINNNSSVIYDANTYSMLVVQSNLMTTSNWTIISVLNNPGNTTSAILANPRASGASETRTQLNHGFTFEVSTGGAGRLTSPTTAAGTGTRILMGISTPARVDFYNNGSLTGSNTTAITTYSTDAGGLPTIGGYRNTETGSNDNSWLTATIYELLVFNSSLTTSERQQVEGYLAWKWGLQNNLPTTHPYYKFRP